MKPYEGHLSLILWFRAADEVDWLRVTLRPIYSDATQLDVELSSVELSCVAIDTLTDATQLSPAISNATDPVAAYSQSARSRSVELSWVVSLTQLNSTYSTSSWVELCRYKRAFKRIVSSASQTSRRTDRHAANWPVERYQRTLTAQRGKTDDVIWMMTGDLLSARQEAMCRRQMRGLSTVVRCRLQLFQLDSAHVRLISAQAWSWGFQTTTDPIVCNNRYDGISSSSSRLNNKLSCRREVARCFLPLNISPSHSSRSKSFEMTAFGRHVQVPISISL